MLKFHSSIGQKDDPISTMQIKFPRIKSADFQPNEITLDLTDHSSRRRDLFWCSVLIQRYFVTTFHNL